MPRARKQVSRFDPSPEVVASWNDTSGKTRLLVDLQARVRHGLSSAESAAALLAAAQAKTSVGASTKAARGTVATGAVGCAAPGRRRPTPAGAGRKRQRASPPAVSAGASGGSGGGGGSSSSGGGGSSCRNGSSSSSSSRKCPPPFSGIRGDHCRNPHAGEGGGGGSPATDGSSISCGTSGSESDSSFSFPPEGVSHSENAQRLAWRPSQGAGGGGTANGGGGGGGASFANANANVSTTASMASDTDSEYCSDLIPGQQAGGSSATCSENSDRSSSCSMNPLGFGDFPADADVGGESASPRGGSAKGRAKEVEGRSEQQQEQQATKRRRNVVTVRVARSQMPARWAAPPPPFETCLKDVLPEDRLGGATPGGGDDAMAAAAASMLGLCDEGDAVDARNWLSSGFIDVIMAKFARTYTNVSFMPIDFAALCLNGWGSTDTTAPAVASAAAVPPPSSPAQPSRSATSGGRARSEGGDGRTLRAATAAALADERMVFKDILGRPVVYAEKRPVIFLTHVNNVHWNLLRVEHHPVPELQLFEPMGKPPRRQGGSRYYNTKQQQRQQSGGGGSGGGSGARGGGFRCIPKEVYRWLDAVWPLHSCRESVGGGSGGGGGEGAAGARAGKSRKAKGSTASPSNDGWACRAYSAITQQQQTTGFDCGVAALLYAEKCGQGQMRQDVDAWTTQEDMTEYRRALQRYVEEVLRQPQPQPQSRQAATAAATVAAVSSSSASTSKPVAAAVAAAPAPPAAAKSSTTGRVLSS